MSRLRVAIAWAAILALATVLRFVDLSRESYWLDELATLDVIGESWSRFATVLARFDNHPPLYFAIAKAWTSVFGADETALRSLSALLGVACVFAAGALARSADDPGFGSSRVEAATEAGRSGNNRTPGRLPNLAALSAGALVAVLPIAVRHAREARMYSLLTLTSLLALQSLVALFRTPRPRIVAAALAAHVALLYTHVYGALLVGGETAFVVGLFALDRDRRADARLALATLLTAVLAFAPWLPVLRSRTATVGERFWIGSPGWSWSVEWGGGHWLGGAFVAAIGLAAAVGVVRSLGSRRDEGTGLSRRERSVLALVAIASLTALPIAIAVVYRPIFVPKYASGAAAVLCVLAAISIASMPRTRALVALALCTGVGLAATITHVLRPRLNEDWRAVAVVARAACTDRQTVVAAARYAPMYRHYLDDDCLVLDIESLGTDPSAPSSGVLRTTLANAREVLLLEVHPPRTDPRVESLLEATHHRSETFRATEARATRWIRNAD